MLLFPCDARYPSLLLKEVSLIGAIEACATRLCSRTFSVGLILKPREGWGLLIFSFSLLWLTVLTCSGRASVTATEVIKIAHA